MEGVELKSEELKSYGITTVTRRVEFDAARQLAAIDELLKEGIHGLILAPCNDISIRNKINEMADTHIPVVTVNTDIDGSKRIAYVGSDYVQGGCMAAGLFALMTAGDVELGVVTGSAGVLCHSERVRGLEKTLIASYPRIHIAGIVENHDDDIESYNATRELLMQHSDIDALFFAAAGVYGGCRAVQESGLHPKIVTFDDVPTTLDMLKDGVISATISQQTSRQGSLSLDILFDFLTAGLAPERELNYVEHTIRIRENI